MKIPDTLLGAPRHATARPKVTRVCVPMPEGVYLATVTITQHTMRRPRWPWPKSTRLAEIVPDTPIPRPGPYDDDDATESLLMNADTASEAVTELMDTVLRAREGRR